MGPSKQQLPPPFTLQAKTDLTSSQHKYFISESYTMIGLHNKEVRKTCSDWSNCQPRVSSPQKQGCEGVKAKALSQVEEGHRPSAMGSAILSMQSEAYCTYCASI